MESEVRAGGGNPNISAIVIAPGYKFGEWVVLKRGPNAKGHYRWWCLCSCGRKTLVHATSLRTKKSTRCLTCGVKTRKDYHGWSSTPTYKVWENMWSRCTKSYYEYHAGKGITVCRRWKSFHNFLKDMGTKPRGKGLDRQNNAGNYTPSNCRWATPTQQMNNMSRNYRITFKGKTKTLAEWTRVLQMTRREVVRYMGVPEYGNQL